MRRVESEFKCPMCYSPNKMRYAKPTTISVSRFPLTCGTCGAEYKMAVRIKRGTQNKEVTFDATMVKAPPFKRPAPKELFGVDKSLGVLNEEKK